MQLSRAATGLSRENLGGIDVLSFLRLPPLFLPPFWRVILAEPTIAVRSASGVRLPLFVRLGVAISATFRTFTAKA